MKINKFTFLMCLLFTYNIGISQSLNNSPIVIPPISVNYNSPRLIYSQDDINTMNTNINSGNPLYNHLITELNNRATAANSYTTSMQVYTAANSGGFKNECREAGQHAEHLALHYKHSNLGAFAIKAVEIIDSWATAHENNEFEWINNCSSFGTVYTFYDNTQLPYREIPDWGYDLSWGIINMTFAYDLLKSSNSNSSLLSAEQISRIDAFFKQVANAIIASGIKNWDENNYYHSQLYNNHLTAHIMAITAIGYVTSDRELVQYAIDSRGFSIPNSCTPTTPNFHIKYNTGKQQEYLDNLLHNPRDFVTMLKGVILMPGDVDYFDPNCNIPGILSHRGEIYDRYRICEGKGLTYAHHQLEMLLTISEIAYTNGIDFYDTYSPSRKFYETNENLRYTFDYYADFARTQDYSIKGNFYNNQLQVNTDPIHWYSYYEIALKRYPDLQSVRFYLSSIDRTSFLPNVSHIFTWSTLTNQENVSNNEKATVGEFLKWYEFWKPQNLRETRFGLNTYYGVSDNHDPYVFRNNLDELQLSCDDFSSIEIRMRVNSDVQSNMQVFWGTISSSGFSSTRKVGITTVKDNNYHIYTLDMTAELEWTDTLESLRIDPMEGANDIGKHFNIDWVRLVPNNSSSASMNKHSNPNNIIYEIPLDLKQEQFSIYPNPTNSGRLTVESYNSNISSIIISNLNGQEVFSVYPNLSKTMITKIFSPGVYIVVVNGTHKKKIIVE